MIIGRDNIKAWLQGNGPFWKLYSGKIPIVQTGENAKQIPPMQECTPSNCQTETEAAERFSRVISWLAPGTYTIKGSVNENFSRGFSIAHFEILSSETMGISGHQQQQEGPIYSSEAISGMVTEKFETWRKDYERNQEVKRLREELKEYKGNENNTLAQIAGFLGVLKPHAPQLAPWIESLVAKFLKPQAALMTGVVPDSQQNPTQPPQYQDMPVFMPQPAQPAQQEPTQEEINKCETALSILAQADPNLGDHLLKLAKIAQHQPETYQQLIQMLETFSID
jgi:hypothetical protein